MLYSVDHNSPHFVNSASLSCWFSRRCFALAFFSFSTDGSWWSLPSRSRRYIVSFARRILHRFVLFDFPLAIFVIFALVRTVLHYTLFRRSSRVHHFDPTLLGSALTLCGFTWARGTMYSSTRSGMHASPLFSIRLSLAADLKETPLRLSNDPFFICTVCLVNFSIFNGKRFYLLGSSGSVFPVLW